MGPAKPVINNITGAISIQNAFEIADWLGMLGDPLGYAGTLQSSHKPVLVQFGYGDLEVPNPTESAFVRAAGLQPSTWFFQFLTAVEQNPALAGVTMLVGTSQFPILPHRILSNPTMFEIGDPNAVYKMPGVGAEQTLALALQKQIAAFFTNSSHPAPDPDQFLNGSIFKGNLFQPSPPLPEALNFVQIQP
jgi:hypothetical protein